MSIKQGDKILFILAILLLAAVLVFKFGFKPGDGDSVVETKPGKVNLLVTQLRESEPEEGLSSFLIEQYETLHPELSIRQNIQSYDELREALAAVGEDAIGPDIIIMEGRYLTEFIRTETFGSLSSSLRSDTPLAKWVLPLASSIDVLFYNIDILKAAGFDRPPRDRAEFLRYARAASGAGQYGAALALSPADPRGVYRDVFSWIWAAGAVMIKDGVPDFSGRQITDTLAFLAQLNSEGSFAPQNFTATGAERLKEFAAGKIAMMIGSIQDIAKVREGMNDSAFGITLIPGPAASALKPVFGLSTWYAGIRAKSEHADEARDFLLYLQENSIAIAEQIRAVPGSGDLAAPWITEDPFYAKAWDMYEAADPVQELTAFPKIRELENAVREELAKMFADGQSPADTAAAIQKRWE